MKRLSRWCFVAALAVVAQVCALPVTPAAAQFKITVDYLPPKSKAYLPLIDRLKAFRFLEQLGEFLSPLRLPHQFSLVTSECGVINAFYQPPLWRINICYEFVDSLERIAPKVGEQSQLSFEEVVVGGLVGAILHETGHAVFDMLDVPVFGREEDAADQMSMFLAMQFNSDIARKIVRGFVYWNRSGASRSPLYSDEHGTPLQRYYNALCIGWGGAPDVFKEFSSDLPKERAAGCPQEYQQIKNAFVKSVLPFLDQDAVQKVQARQWLKFTPEQAAALQQRQVKEATFDFAACNIGKVTNVSIAVLGRTAEDPKNWRVSGWFAIPNGGCNYIGSFVGDKIYWYGTGAGNSVWGAPDSDKTAKKQCINKAKAFDEVAGTKCPSGEVLVNFRARDVVAPATGATLRLN